MADRDDKVFIDIGVTILAIAKSDISQVVYSDQGPAEQTDQGEDEVEPIVENDLNLYRTVETKEMDIEQCVDQVAEAVVKVSTPGGLGLLRPGIPAQRCAGGEVRAQPHQLHQRAVFWTLDRGICGGNCAGQGAMPVQRRGR